MPDLIQVGKHWINADTINWVEFLDQPGDAGTLMEIKIHFAGPRVVCITDRDDLTRFVSFLEKNKLA